MYFRACGWFWLSSVQRARRVGDEKYKKIDRKKERIAENPKSGRQVCRVA